MWDVGPLNPSWLQPFDLSQDCLVVGGDGCNAQSDLDLVLLDALPQVCKVAQEPLLDRRHQ